VVKVDYKIRQYLNNICFFIIAYSPTCILSSFDWCEVYTSFLRPFFLLMLEAAVSRAATIISINFGLI